MSTGTERRASRRFNYPLWVGLVAIVAAAAPWAIDALREPPAPTTTEAADAGPPDASPSDVEAPASGLVWRVEGRLGLPAPEDLAACLRREGHGEALAMGPPESGPPRVRIGVRGLAAPLEVRPAPGGLFVETPVGRDRRHALAVHLAAAGCLEAGATALFDPGLGRRFEPGEWPGARPGGGLPVDALFSIEAEAGALVSRGLGRLGRPELALVAPGEHAARRDTLRNAIVGLVLVEGEVPDVLALPDGRRIRLLDARAAEGVAWRPAGLKLGGRRLLAAGDLDPPRPPPLTAPAREEPPPPARPERERPRPRPARAEPAAPPPPKPAPPVFRPDYR